MTISLLWSHVASGAGPALEWTVRGILLSQAEVYQLHTVIAVKDILGFDIQVEKALMMDIG